MNEPDVLSINYTPAISADPLACVSKITPKDKALLQDFVARQRPNSISYEDSWGYIIQATRYKGFKWYDPANDTLIFFGRKSASDNTLVVPAFFATPRYLVSVIQQVQAALQAPKTILKNINQIDVSKYSPYGFRKYAKHEAWSKEARFDDQTFPQLVIDLQKLMEKKGRKYHVLRKALNKQPSVHLRNYQESDREAVLKIFDLKDGESKDTKSRQGVYYVSHAMYPKADVNKYVIVDNESGDILGFTATSKVTKKTTALIASLFKPGIKVASIWGMYATLALKFRDGYTRANLGGCETLKIYAFKHEKFPPAGQIGKTHLIYNPKKRSA